MITIDYRSFIAFLFLLSVPYAVASQSHQNDNGHKPTSIFDLLSNEDVVHISISTDIDSLLEKRKTDQSEKATLNFTDKNDIQSEWNVKLKVRGKFRRKTCDFPPIKIKFKKSELKDNDLKNFTSLKLVTHCGEQAEKDELLLKEYLAYKLYNIITHHSFRVQLVKVDWIDESGNNDIGINWGFLIEDEDEVKERIACEHYHDHGALHSQLDENNASMVYLFQYMIGNHDWKIENGQNMCLITDPSTNDVLALPYDFDFSVLVGAYYARVPYKLDGPNKRMYLGTYNHTQHIEAVELFKSKKDEIITEIKSFGHLSRSSRNKMVKYIKSFYSSLKKPLRRPQ